MEIDTLLSKQIIFIYKELEEIDPCSDEYQNRLKELSTLMDMEIELRKVTEERRDRFIKNILTGSGIVLPLVGAFVGTIITLQFEETGMVTSCAGRKWVDKLLSGKK